jgi:hypothetical protein
MAHAQHLFISDGNTVYSSDILLKYVVLHRLKLLRNQANLASHPKLLTKVKTKVKSLSLKWGVIVKDLSLDISLIQDESVNHPFVRYAKFRMNVIQDKIATLQMFVQTEVFPSDLLSFSTYSDEEFIPFLANATFYTDDINEHKNKIKFSILSKSFDELIKDTVNIEAEGENFQDLSFLSDDLFSSS